jgi:hypothetical protein
MVELSQEVLELDSQGEAIQAVHDANVSGLRACGWPTHGRRENRLSREAHRHAPGVGVDPGTPRLFMNSYIDGFIHS